MKPMVSAGAPVPVLKQPQELGDYAYQAIEKYVKHILKQEKGVLAQRDPEFVHQMRIGLRRLRTATEAFGDAIALPREINDRALKRLAKVLGRVRDLDVLEIWLSRYSQQTHLKKAEKKKLRTVIRRLQKRRRRAVVQMRAYFRSKAYRRLLRACKRWLKCPKYKALAHFPMGLALPDLQLPIVSRLLLHPGWLVTNHNEMTELAQVHALRKRIKGVRYQMALFRDFYGQEYRDQVSGFKDIQDVLGELQDEVVLQEFLVKVLGTKWAKKLPSLKKYFHQQHQQLWQRWLVMRQPYISLEQRHALHQLFLVKCIT